MRHRAQEGRAKRQGNASGEARGGARSDASGGTRVEASGEAKGGTRGEARGESQGDASGEAKGEARSDAGGEGGGRRAGATPSRRHDQSEPEFLHQVGETLRTLRARRGMTRKALAAQAHVSERYIAQMETGAGNASLLVARALATALGA